MEKIVDAINHQLVAKMHENEFSLQLNGTTNSSSNKIAYLICYERFIDNYGNIVKDLLFCKPILTSYRAHDSFAILNIFLEKNNVE